MPTPIINQQLDDLNDAMGDIKEAIENLPFAGVPEAVADWLDDHPEATTTVQDGAITAAKLASALSDAIFLPKKTVKKVLDADSAGSGSINIGEQMNLYDELIITVYQSDTTNSGTEWSTNPTSNYVTIRDSSASAATGYVQGFPNLLKGDKPAMLRLKRLSDCIYCSLKNGDEAEQVAIIQRESTYKDYLTWITISANTGKTLKAGAKIEVVLKRM